jgi:hypothetical protein
MLSDSRGEMGFMEAMVSILTVTIVISMYLAFAATASATAYEPLSDFDPESLEFEITDSVQPILMTDLDTYIIDKDLRGLRITMAIPYFMEGTVVYQTGDEGGLEHQARYFMLLSAVGGRTLPTILEVEAFV